MSGEESPFGDVLADQILDGALVALSAPFRPMSDHVVVAGGQLYVTAGSSVRAYAR